MEECRTEFVDELIKHYGKKIEIKHNSSFDSIQINQKKNNPLLKKIELIIKVDELYIPQLTISDNISITIKTNASKVNIFGGHLEELVIKGIKPHDIREVKVKGKIVAKKISFAKNKSLSKCEGFTSYTYIDSLDLSETAITHFKNYNNYYYTVGELIVEKSKIEEIKLEKTFRKFKLLAKDSKLKRILISPNSRVEFNILDVENTPLEYIDLSYPHNIQTIQQLNIRNTNLSEETKKRLLPFMQNADYLKIDHADKIVFYKKDNLEYFLYKEDIGFIFFSEYNDNNLKTKNGITKILKQISINSQKIKNDFKPIDSFLLKYKFEEEFYISNDPSQMEKQKKIKEALKIYKEKTGNTELMRKLSLGGTFEQMARDRIDPTKYSIEDVNQHNIYNKSAIHYAQDINTIQFLIKKMNYNIIKEDIDPNLFIKQEFCNFIEKYYLEKISQNHMKEMKKSNKVSLNKIKTHI